jgi:hypothetical protein
LTVTAILYCVYLYSCVKGRSSNPKSRLNRLTYTQHNPFIQNQTITTTATLKMLPSILLAASTLLTRTLTSPFIPRQTTNTNTNTNILNVTNAHWDGQCFYPESDDDFELNDYLGRWYQVAGTIAPFTAGCKCIYAEYSLNVSSIITIIIILGIQTRPDQTRHKERKGETNIPSLTAQSTSSTAAKQTAKQSTYKAPQPWSQKS